MVENGFYNFLNWFDERAWYPLGRIVGGTVGQGLLDEARSNRALFAGLSRSDGHFWGDPLCLVAAAHSDTHSRCVRLSRAYF